jgi:hypothetical protein
LGKVQQGHGRPLRCRKDILVGVAGCGGRTVGEPGV